jgi:hypothetical protein
MSTLRDDEIQTFATTGAREHEQVDTDQDDVDSDDTDTSDADSDDVDPS